MTLSGRAFAKQLDSLGPWLALGVVCVVLGLGVRAAIALVENAAWVEHTHQTIEVLEELSLGVSVPVRRRAWCAPGTARG